MSTALATPALATPSAGAVPGAPQSVTATAGNAKITVNWQAPASSGSSAITGYTVTCVPGTGTAKSATVGGSTLTATVAGLTNGTAYSCAVKATNAAGTGPAASAGSATPVGPPGAPRNVTNVTAAGKITVKWSKPLSTGGSAITGYPVGCASTDGGAPLSGTAAASATMLALTGLPDNLTYRCTVKATSSLGTSAAANANGWAEHLVVTTADQSPQSLHFPVTGSQESVTVDKSTFNDSGEFTITSANGTTLFDDGLDGGFDQYVYGEYDSPSPGTTTATFAPYRGDTKGSVEIAGYSFTDVHSTITANGSLKTATFAYPGQTGRYDFPGTAGQQVSLTTGTCPITGGYIHLYDPAENELTFTGIGSQAFFDATTLPSAATYTIAVDHGFGTGSCQLHLYTVPQNTGTITSGGTAVPLSFTVPGENATRTFSGTAGQFVNVSYTGSTIDGGEIDLDDAAGNELTYVQIYDDPSSTYSTGKYKLTKTGTYSIVVDPSYAHLGQLTVKLASG